MRTIRLIAFAVFRESVRDRVPLTIVGFGVLLVMASFLISQMTAGQDVKIIKDLGLSALSILGVLIAVFIGIGLVAKEIERRSIYSLLSKPVTREELVLALRSTDELDQLAEKEGKSRDELEDALRNGLVRAVGQAEDEGLIGDTTAGALRFAAEHLPIGLLLDVLRRGSSILG